MNIKKIIDKVENFITHDVWSLSNTKNSRQFIFYAKQVRVIILAIKSFQQNKCNEKASSLTYYTLLSIVPVCALMFGIAKGFGFEEKMQDYLYTSFEDKKEMLDQIFEFTHKMLQNTQSGLVAGIGLVMLLWSVMKLLGNIEQALNGIWEISKNRNTIRKISDYFSIMLIAPILLILSNSATTFISNYVNELKNQYEFFNNYSWLISNSMKLLPWSLTWIAFTLIYIIMPNTKVALKPALIGGIIGGISFQIVEYLYIKFQIGVANYNAIYGSFAALPLFLVWLQTSWTIVLIGAEIAFANQNASRYEFETEIRNISHNLRIKLAIYITQYLTNRFDKELPPISTTKLADNLGIPQRILNTIIKDLIDARIIIEVTNSDDKMNCIQISTPISKLTIYKVIQRINQKGLEQLDILQSPKFNEIDQIINNLYTSIDLNSENILLKELNTKLENKTSIQKN